MKLLSRTTKNRAGNVLLYTVVSTGLVGFLMATYLGLVKSQNVATMRSQSWNRTLPVIEAGIEEALTHLQAHSLSGNLVQDGWQLVNGVYYMQRQLGDDYYVVTITNYFGPTSLDPIVDSRGYVKMPTHVASISSGPVFATAVGSPAYYGYIARGVRVHAGKSALFAKGMVAKGQIDLNGNSIESDSFDSSDPNYSTGGLYDPTKRKDKGDIATNSELVNSLNVGNADIYGTVSTGPGGSVDIGPHGTVGSLAWHASGKKGIEAGYSTDDMNVDFPDVEEPYPAGSGVYPMAGPFNGLPYNYILDGGNFSMPNIDMKSSSKMIVTSPSKLYISGNVSLSGSAQIEIAPGASLELYVAGASANLGGNGVINHAGNATDFIYYGLPSNTSLSFGGNGTFTGIIYAPEADFTLSGGGSGVDDFIGASITKTVTMNGHFRFHYDEALANFYNDGRYVVNSWNEMTSDQVLAWNWSPPGVQSP